VITAENAGELGAAAAALWGGWQAYKAKLAARGAEQSATSRAQALTPVAADQGFVESVRASLARIESHEVEQTQRLERVEETLGRHIEDHARASLRV